jgi:hypothetical protein
MARKKLTTKRRRVEAVPRSNEPLLPPSQTEVDEPWEPIDGALVRFGGVEAREFVRYPGGGSAVPEDEPDPQWSMGMQDATPIYDDGNLVGAVRLPPLPMNHRFEQSPRSVLRVKLQQKDVVPAAPQPAKEAASGPAARIATRARSVHDSSVGSPHSPQAGVMTDVPHPHHATALEPHAVAIAALGVIASSSTSPQRISHGHHAAAVVQEPTPGFTGDAVSAAAPQLDDPMRAGHSHAGVLPSAPSPALRSPRPQRSGSAVDPLASPTRPVLSVPPSESADSVDGVVSPSKRQLSLRSPLLSAEASSSSLSSPVGVARSAAAVAALAGVVTFGTVDQHQRWKELYNVRRRLLRAQVCESAARGVCVTFGDSATATALVQSVIYVDASWPFPSPRPVSRTSVICSNSSRTLDRASLHYSCRYEYECRSSVNQLPPLSCTARLLALFSARTLFAQSEDDGDNDAAPLFRPLPKEERAAVFNRDVLDTGLMVRSELNEANKVS